MFDNKTPCNHVGNVDLYWLHPCCNLEQIKETRNEINKYQDGFMLRHRFTIKWSIKTYQTEEYIKFGY